MSRCCVVPPYVLEALAAREEAGLASLAAGTLRHDTELRRWRAVRAEGAVPATPVRPVRPPAVERAVSDAD